MKPRISVAVPVYNGAAVIGRAIESILDQNPPPHEILILDDESTDDLQAVLRQWESPLIRYFKRGRSGLARTRNAAIKECTGTHLSFLDADDRLAPGYILAVSEKITRDDPDLIHTGYVLTKRDGTVVRTSRLGTSRSSQAHILLMVYGNYISVSGTTVRVERIREAGGFYDGLDVNCGCEDWDMWIRLTLSGTVSFIPSLLVDKEYNPNGPYKRFPAEYRRDMETVVRRGLTNDRHLEPGIRERAIANLYYLWASVEWERRAFWGSLYFFASGLFRFPGMAVWVLNRGRMRELLERGAS